MSSESPEASESIPRRPRAVINPPVFFGSAILSVIFVLFGMIAPDTAAIVFRGIQGWVVESAGWFYVLAVAFFLVFVVCLAVSDMGKIKLGPDHSEPDYSYASWFAMLFSAGMGIGLMYFGVAEPMMHYIAPPVGEGATVDAAREALRITLFHWGVHAWAIYAVVALSLAYFSFRHGLPLTIRSALYPLIGERVFGPIGHAVDIFAVLGTLFGVATSLGFGVIQVNAGLNYLFDVPVSALIQMVLIVVITGLATLSVGLGLDTGIRRVSELNIILAVVLLVFVLVFGPTIFLLQTFVQNTGNYISGIFSSTFNLYAYQPTGWIGGWTLFYWGWWIAWSPFVGMFIARVSRGRTIRQFVVGVLFVPVGFTCLWMTVFGDTAIHMVMMEGITELAVAVDADESVALFKLLEYLPFSGIISLLATVLVVTFFITSSDSGSLVVDMLTAGGDKDSPLWQRIFWALTEGLIAAVLLLAGGLDALQTASIASALPFSIIMLFMCWGLIRALRLEAVKRVSTRTARLSPSARPSGVSWQSRIRSIVHFPRREEVDRFMREVVKPAFEQVVEELRKENLEASVGEGDEGRMWLEIAHGDEMDFYYLVRVHPFDPPSFALSDTRAARAKSLKFYRAEVHFKEGGQNYDIMGWHKNEVISDVLDQYERHMHFLQTIR